MAEKKSTAAKPTSRKRATKSKLLCTAKLSDGKPCPKNAEVGKTFCRWHDLEDETWREVYAQLERSTPEEKADIVLELIQEHPEYLLELQEREGLRANLDKVDLSRDALDKRRNQPRAEGAPWWSADGKSVDLSGADLHHASLVDANLHGAILANANLQYATLERVNLESAVLWRANLKYAWLHSINLQSANVVGAELQHALLNGSNLQGANLQLANLQDAKLWNVNLQNASLMGSNLQEAFFNKANLRGAVLSEAKLQGVDLSMIESMANVYISGAWLDRTRMWHEDFGGALGEELDQDYTEGKRAYLALKKNFDDLGDYEAASWAYRKERRMEKLEARGMGRAALKERKGREATTGYFKFFSDTFVEWLCDYGESVWRVVGWMAVLLFVLGPLLFSSLGGIVWTKELTQDYFAASSWDRLLLWYRTYLLYTLDTMTTASFSGLQPINDAVKLASGLFAIAGIVLAGLLGFVAGNRIRRS